MMEEKETAKEYRLQQFVKWKGGWEVLYYAMTTPEREALFDRLYERIDEFEDVDQWIGEDIEAEIKRQFPQG